MKVDPGDKILCCQEKNRRAAPHEPRAMYALSGEQSRGRLAVSDAALTFAHLLEQVVVDVPSRLEPWPSDRPSLCQCALTSILPFLFPTRARVRSSLAERPHA